MVSSPTQDKASRKKVNMTPGVHRTGWSLDIAHGSEFDQSDEVASIYRRIVKRDKYTCQGCNLRSKRYMEIHPRDGNHRDYSAKNAITLCPLCHQVFHLASASFSSGAELMWLPEVSQEAVNILSVSMFVVLRHQKHPMKEVALSIQAAMANRVSLFRSRFGTQDPGALAQMLIRMPEGEYQKRAEKISAVKLMPKAERFKPAIRYWDKNVYAKFGKSGWSKSLPSDFDVSRFM